MRRSGIPPAVAKLIYSSIVSLDGYVEDARGGFGWAAPDEEVHGFVNDRQRPIGTYLYGRRMYETMIYWETAHEAGDQPPVERDFTEIWQAADKLVYSRTLEAPASARTRIEREFEPEAIRRLKAEAAGDISIGGPGLAEAALRAGLIDEISCFSPPSSLAGASRRCRMASLCRSSWSSSGASATARSSSATETGRRCKPTR